MSSIYTDNFNQILNRVNSKSKAGTSKQASASPKSEDFGKLLSSVENKRTFEKSSSTQDKLNQNNILTNIVSESEFYHKSMSINSPANPLSGTIVGDVPLEDHELSSVNIPTNIDKGTTQGAPPTGTISHNNTIAMSAEEKPLIPMKDRIEPPNSIRVEENKTNSVKTEKRVPLPKSELKNIIMTAGKYHGVDPSLGLAIAQAESSFNPNAVSKDGFASKGVFQLLDSTAEDMQALTGMNEPYQPFDPGMNTFLGMGYLRRLHDIFSQNSQITNSTKTVAAKSASELEKIAVAAYNAGEGSVARAQEYARSLGKDPSLFSSIEPHLPAITRSYVKKVDALRKQFRNDLASEDIG